MRYGVLGTINVHAEGERIDLGGTQQRRLLGILLTAPGRVFSVDRLTEALWADGLAPAGARRSVLTYMSRLRACVGEAAIVTRDGGYLFDASRLADGGSTLDSIEFEGLVQQARSGDPDAAAASYEEALSLWRGPAFGDFAGEWWAVAHAARLDELRAVARESHAEVLIALGQRARAIPELEALLLDLPLRERVVELLMQALDGVGRKAEALRVFHSYRDTVIDSTGLGPSQNLIELEATIATGERRFASVDGRPLRGYILHEAIGRGDHGTVYAARQPGTERDVAIKVIRAEFADSVDYVRRFELEARFVARLEHPHIVPLYDFWREPGGAFLVFRLLRGGTAASSLVTGGRWSLERVDRLVEEIGGALMFAHAAGVTHRDVRPANILLDGDDRLFISDFGIAAEPGAAASNSWEQPLEPTEMDDAMVDVRDLACTVWELLAGRPPGRPMWRSALPTLLDVVPGLPPEVDAVLNRASTTDRGLRFESMAELMLAWRAAVRQPDRTRAANESSANRTSSERRLAALQLSARTRAGVNPYRGLRSFGETDARDFFGRDAVTIALTETIDRTSFVALVGPSGAGKSSLVHAGVLPRFRQRAGWLSTSMTPGAHPLASLHAALTEVSRTPLVADQPSRSIGAVAGQTGAGLLLIVDQFEECWTMAGPVERELFLAALAGCGGDDAGGTSVVVTLRADMFDLPLQHPLLGPLIARHTFPLTPMTGAELEDAVVLPAARSHVAFGDGVVSSIVTDAAANPASLPLMQFTLFELFERRVDGVIGADEYEAVGGIAGSIARRAEALYEVSSVADREHIRTLFGRLVHPGDDLPDARRRVAIGDVPEPARRVANDFVAARLLVGDHDPVSREPTIEVAHEAILSRWQRLGEWIGDDRRWLAQLHHLTAATRAWTESGRPSAELYRGSRLEAVLEQMPTRRGQLTDQEIEFVEESRRDRDSELQHQRRSARRLRRSLIGVALLLVVATVSASIAVVQRRAADRRTRDARIAALVGDIASVRGTQRDTAALLAVEAFRLQDTPQTRSALMSSFTSSPGFLDTHHLDDGQQFHDGAVMPNGTSAFIVGQDQLVHPYNLETGHIGDPLPRQVLSGSWLSVLPSPDGSTLAQLAPITVDGKDATLVARYDVASGQPIGRPVTVDLAVGSFAFSVDARQFAVAGSTDGSVIEFDTRTGDELARSAGDPVATGATAYAMTAGLVYLPDGRIAVGSPGDRVRLLDPKTLAAAGKPIPVPAGTSTRLFSVDDGAGLIGVGRDGVTRLEVATQEVRWALAVGDISADGCSNSLVIEARQRLYCADAYGRLDERDLTTGGLVRTLDAQNGNAGSLWSARNDTELVSFGNNEPIVARWRLDGSGPITRRVDPMLTPVQYSPNGTMLAAEQLSGDNIDTSVPGTAVVVDSIDGRIVEHLQGLVSAFWNDDDSLGGAVALPDGRLQVAHYEMATHTLGTYSFIFSVPTTRTLINTGQPKAWVGVTGDDGRPQVWTFDRATGDRVDPTYTFDTLVWIAGSPDGKRFAATTTQGVEFFDGDTGAKTGHIDESDLRGVYYVTNDMVAISSLGGELILYDADTLTPIRTLTGARGFIQDVVPSTDGSVVAVRGGDRRVQMVDVASGTPIGGPIDIPDDEANIIAMPPDAHEVAIGGGTSDGIAIWDLDPQHWIAAACRLAGRSLTHAEWDTYLGTLEAYRPTCG